MKEKRNDLRAFSGTPRPLIGALRSRWEYTAVQP